MLIGINKAVIKKAALLYFKSIFSDHAKFENTECVGFFFFIITSTPFAYSISKKEEENKSLQDLLPINIINPEVYTFLKKKEHWIDIEVSIVVKTIVQ